MTRYLWAALIVGGLLWPSVASAEHLEGTKAHVVEFDDGTWRAAFKVELWSHRTRVSTILRLVIDQEGCHLTPLAEQSTSSLQVPKRLTLGALRTEQRMVEQRTTEILDSFLVWMETDHLTPWKP